MKIYKNVVIPETIEKRVEKVICDKCNKDIKSDVSYSGYESNWFKVLDGTNYPEDNFSFSGTKYKMDLCLKCSLELVENLKKLDYKIQEFDD